MRGFKVVTAQEMARVEALAVNAGASQEEFMRSAAEHIYDAVLFWTERYRLPRIVTLLAWKGNKSGDGFAAANLLLEEGYQVRCLHLAPLEECTPLCKKFAEKFRRKGGELLSIGATDPLPFEQEGVIIDALLGTGFKGRVEGVLRRAIDQANGTGRRILSIDLPSGLDGTTGDCGVVVHAHATVTLGLPKSGLFLKNGWNFVGDLLIADIGLPQEVVDLAEPIAFLPELSLLRYALPRPVRNHHKYQRGLVLGFAGTAPYTGAAKLSSLAALRGGAGCVKQFYMPGAENADGAPEVMRIPWSEAVWKEALKQAKAVYFGPGLGRSEEVRCILEKITSSLSLPTVIDADALQPWIHLPAVSICTPHRGEMLRLLGEKELDEQMLLQRCQMFCEEKQTVLLLKGAPTWIFLPGKKPYLIVQGDPGMATAGSGDVLTGLLASLLAQGSRAEEAAVLGSTLHALAGENAVKQKTTHCMIASDLIESLPQAYKTLLDSL